MPRPAMYSPDISQHSPRLYRLGKHYGISMTALADRLVAFGLQRLTEVMPDRPAPAPMLILAPEPLKPIARTVPRKAA